MRIKRCGLLVRGWFSAVITSVSPKPKKGAAPQSGQPCPSHKARRIIVPKLKAAGVQCWSGWHGSRRGLAANLFELGEDEATIQAILRQADVKTTQRHYIKKNVVSKESKQAMNRLA
jgi:hypothetical protein